MLKLFRKKGFLFFLYIVFFTGLALFYHRDVIFNPYNYGRHWDWSFYTYSRQYLNYLHSFYSIRDVGLSNYDVFSVNVSEYSVKLFIYLTYRLLSFVKLPLSISIINKLTVFLLFHILSATGIWFLSKNILKDIYKRKPYLFYITTTLSALLYSFSMVIIFDLHGGALNRQLSAFIFPWFFSFLYDYFETTYSKRSYSRIVLLSILLMFFDISNIFYFGSLILFAILLKKETLRTKLSHVAVLGLFSLFLNFYWIQGLVVSNSLNLQSLLEQKRTDVTVLQAYSSPHRNNLFVTSTPHDLINFVFKNNMLVYLPFLILFIFIVRNLVSKNDRPKDRRLLLFLIGGLLFSLMLTSGTYSVGNVYEFLYRFYFLSFIQGAVRYMPNLAIYLVFVFLATTKIYANDRNNSFTNSIFSTLAVLAITGFLVTNNDLIKRVYIETTKGANQNININNEIGALYKLDPTLLKTTSAEKLMYSILPVPSWLSPLFIDNFYPSSSQGSDTEVYFDKSLVLTSGSVGLASQFLETFIDRGFSPEFFGIANIRYLSFKDYKLINEQVIRSFYFSKKYIKKSLPDDPALNIAIKKNTIYKLDDQYFLPLIYSPRVVLETEKLKTLPALLKKVGLSNSPSVLVKEQNKDKNLQKFSTNTAHLEYKKINPTKYRVRIHGATKTVPLVLSKLFYAGWNAVVVPYSNSSKTLSTTGYKIIDGNDSDQISAANLKLYIAKGWISTVGSGESKRAELTSYFGTNEEKTAYGKPYTIDFISNMYSNSIQNENLPNGGALETFASQTKTIDQSSHFLVNGFSNMWLLDADRICAQSQLCKQNTDGSYDLEVILEFTPQRIFTTGILLSGLSLAFAILFVLKNKNGR